jgi:hypothetical protein
MEYKIICRIEIGKHLANEGVCTITKTENGIYATTDNPQKCQEKLNETVNDREKCIEIFGVYIPNHKLLFGKDYDEMILHGKYFTV